MRFYAATISQIPFTFYHLYRLAPVIHFAWLGDMAAAIIRMGHDPFDGSIHQARSI